MRKIILAVSLFVLFGVLNAFTQGQDFSKVEMKVQKVAGSIYMIEGAGGNIAASVGDDGIVMVDDEFLPLADKIEAALKGITDKPVKVVLNTHWHGDHTGGNPHFGEKPPSWRRKTCASAWSPAGRRASARPSQQRRLPCPSLLLKMMSQFI